MALTTRKLQCIVKRGSTLVSTCGWNPRTCGNAYKQVLTDINMKIMGVPTNGKIILISIKMKMRHVYLNKGQFYEM